MCSQSVPDFTRALDLYAHTHLLPTAAWAEGWRGAFLKDNYSLIPYNLGYIPYTYIKWSDLCFASSKGFQSRKASERILFRDPMLVTRPSFASLSLKHTIEYRLLFFHRFFFSIYLLKKCRCVKLTGPDLYFLPVQTRSACLELKEDN